jgi:hypothetical protein
MHIARAIRRRLGRALATYLSRPAGRGSRSATCSHADLSASLRKGDVLLVDGDSRFSVAVRYLSQSTWSHSALCVAAAGTDAQDACLVEADVVEGVRAVPLAKYAPFHTRICRPVGLTEAEIDQVVAYARTRLGNHYDLQNVFDLVRYLVRTPPVPDRYKRRMLALGSGDPTRAICSSLIALAFQSVRYPILPEVSTTREVDPGREEARRELLHIRHHSLFVPRDFDVSPYFSIIKPTLERGFDPHALSWAPRPDDAVAQSPQAQARLADGTVGSG